MRTKLLPSESIIKNGGANCQQGWESVGGNLYLTSSRLIFESHKANVQTGSLVMPLNAIKTIGKSWTKFLNILPLAPNAMTVDTSDGSEHRFTLFGRQDWIDAINERLR